MREMWQRNALVNNINRNINIQTENVLVQSIVDNIELINKHIKNMYKFNVQLAKISTIKVVK